MKKNEILTSEELFAAETQLNELGEKIEKLQYTIEKFVCGWLSMIIEMHKLSCVIKSVVTSSQQIAIRIDDGRTHHWEFTISFMRFRYTEEELNSLDIFYKSIEVRYQHFTFQFQDENVVKEMDFTTLAQQIMRILYAREGDFLPQLHAHILEYSAIENQIWDVKLAIDKHHAAIRIAEKEQQKKTFLRSLHVGDFFYTPNSHAKDFHNRKRGRARNAKGEILQFVKWTGSGARVRVFEIYGSGSNPTIHMLSGEAVALNVLLQNKVKLFELFNSEDSNVHYRLWKEDQLENDLIQWQKLEFAPIEDYKI